MKFSLKYLFFGMIIGLVLLFAYWKSLPDQKLHLVFCDVGQGDAIYMRTPDGADILLDGGPNERVLSCLGKHMPFYDRKIELVLLSHPQADHGNGILSVLERYGVGVFVGSLGNLSDLSSLGARIGEKLREKKIAQKSVGAGEKIWVGEVEIRVLWPERTVGELGELETKDELNESSMVVEIGFGRFGALLTGDATAEVLGNLRNLGYLDILKVPHHGSKFGLTSGILEWLRPKLAVISVGKNSYGHPADETLRLLKGLKVLRTDQEGEIEIISDGEKWEARKN